MDQLGSYGSQEGPGVPLAPSKAALGPI